MVCACGFSLSQQWGSGGLISVQRDSWDCECLKASTALMNRSCPDGKPILSNFEPELILACCLWCRDRHIWNTKYTLWSFSENKRVMHAFKILKIYCNFKHNFICKLQFVIYNTLSLRCRKYKDCPELMH